MSNTDELSEFQTINVQNIVFGELYRGNYNTFIPIGIVDQESNENTEEIKPFLINTPPSLYSSGIKAIFDRENKYVTGYNCCINLYNFKNVSEDEKLFTSKLEEIVEYTRSYLHSIKEEFELDTEMIDNFRLVNWSTKPSSTENQAEGDDTAATSTENTKYNPKLYVKLIVNNKSKKILTNFFNEESNEEVDPLTLVDKKGLLTSALKIENVVINKKRIIIEVKMIESLYSKLPTYQPRQQKDRKKKSILRPGVEMKPHKAEVVKPVSGTETKTNNLHDGIRNQNSFKLLETDDDEDVTTHHVESHVL